MTSILIIDDEPAITSAFATFFRQHGKHEVAEAHTGAEGLAAWRRMRPDVTLLDVRLPDMTGFEVLERLRPESPVVIMVTAHGDVPMAVQALQAGAENFLTKPVDLNLLRLAVDRSLEKAALRRMSRAVAAGRRDGAPSLLGSSPSMREVSAQIELLAQSERTTALILGESGTGKGRAAELIHALSSRRSAAVVDINCAVLNAENFDVEMFGAEFGAEATREIRPGRVELADRGSLFLDEVGDLDLLLQPKLLGILAQRPFRRDGGVDEIAADIRVIAASSRDLAADVRAGRFREDLFYRLNVMPVTLPALRERSREDLVELVNDILARLSTSLARSPAIVGDDAMEHMLRYSWPGNIRELQNVLERALILLRGGERIETRHLPSEVRGATGALTGAHEPASLKDVERVHIDRTLRAHNFNRSHAAKELGISRATLIKKIKEYELHPDKR